MDDRPATDFGLPTDVFSARSIRVGVLEDDRNVRDIVSSFLAAQHMTPQELRDGGAAYQAITEGNVDLLLIDLGLGEIDGVDVIRRIRVHSAIPIVIISGRVDTSAVACGLDAGADDYVRKPIAFEELAARIRSVLRRKAAAAPSEARPTAVLAAGSVALNLADREVAGPKGSVRLTERETLILSQLLRNQGNPVSREMLSRALQGEGWNPAKRTLDVHIANIRAKLVAAGAPPTVVRARRNLGYQLTLL